MVKTYTCEEFDNAFASPNTRRRNYGVRDFVVGACQLERFALGPCFIIKFLVSLGEHLNRYARPPFDSISHLLNKLCD